MVPQYHILLCPYIWSQAVWSPECQLSILFPVSEVIKLFSCSTEHEILNAHKYKNIKKLVFF